jgi:hypothetical protein
MSPGRKPEQSLRYTAIAKKLDESGKAFSNKGEKAAVIAQILCAEDGLKPNTYTLRRLINTVRKYL